LFEDDALYEGGQNAALQLPTFLSNHDNGRFAYFVRAARPGIGDEEVVKRVLLAHAMLLTLRGVPVLYYGDEQGFAGLGGDQDARQDMFRTQVPTYKQEKPLGVATQSDKDHFDDSHPFYRAFAELARLRSAHPALRRGRQIVRSYGLEPGLFAVSRIDPDSGREILIAFNTSTAPLSAQVAVNADSRHFTSLQGHCDAEPTTQGSYRVAIAPLEYVICASGDGG
jgi:glycosidase